MKQYIYTITNTDTNEVILVRAEEIAIDPDIVTPPSSILNYEVEEMIVETGDDTFTRARLFLDSAQRVGNETNFDLPSVTIQNRAAKRPMVNANFKQQG